MAQQKQNFDIFGNSNILKALSELPKTGFDFQNILEIQRKNIQALAEAQQLAVDGIQTIAMRQIEIMSQFMEEQSFITNQLLREGTPEDKIAKNAELIKHSYEKAMQSAKEISELVKKTNTKATGLLNKRATANFKEIRETLEQKARNAA